MSHLIFLGLINKIKRVVWIDGLNDLIATVPLPSLGFCNSPISISTNPSFANGLLLKNINLSDRINAFVEFRNFAVLLLQKYGIESLNILQPLNDVQRSDLSHATKLLIPYYSQKRGWVTRKRIPSAFNYITAIGKSRYGLNFHILPSELDGVPIEFFDSAHMSIKGEKQYSAILKNFLNS